MLWLGIWFIRTDGAGGNTHEDMIGHQDWNGNRKRARSTAHCSKSIA